MALLIPCSEFRSPRISRIYGGCWLGGGAAMRFGGAWSSSRQLLSVAGGFFKCIKGDAGRAIPGVYGRALTGLRGVAGAEFGV